MVRQPSFGATIAVDWASGTSYATIAQVRDISGPSVSREAIEVPPDHDMVGSAWQLKFAGIPTAGQMTFELNLDTSNGTHVGAGNLGLLGSFDTYYNGTSLPAWRYQNTRAIGTATWTFDGFVAGMDFSMGDVQGSQSASLTVEIAGRPTLTVT